ncbi:hypothetical protein A6P39_001355 [Streptomyces sp. FXJ1.172]|nr:hypothetical protein [Streptomyces sp. FXJ1.172]WEO92865.1 hypothetical protein A6P39_001355 [Streptomyces sp. FXJ1.172]
MRREAKAEMIAAVGHADLSPGTLELVEAELQAALRAGLVWWLRLVEFP